MIQAPYVLEKDLSQEYCLTFKQSYPNVQRRGIAIAKSDVYHQLAYQLVYRSFEIERKKRNNVPDDVSIPYNTTITPDGDICFEVFV